MNLDFDPILSDIRKHAAELAPRECCGLAIVERGKLRYVPCRNLYGPGAEVDAFAIDSADYAAAEERGEIVAVVHSHVGVPPVPSMADRVSMNLSTVPWLIVNTPSGEWSLNHPDGYKAPLIGRPFVHGVLDCYSLVRDYYRENCGIDLPDIHRDDRWWDKGQTLYLDHFEAAGFVQIAERDLREHDGILMMSGSKTPNHAAVYIGGNVIVQHVMGRLSSRDVWGGYWRKCATHFLRHRSLL